MSQPFDASRSLTSLEQGSTIIAVIEMSQAKWLVAAVVPGVERQPLKRLDADEAALLKLLHADVNPPTGHFWPRCNIEPASIQDDFRAARAT
jgi:hypothetical protein